MVFQDYALFPHLTVEQNLLYGLKFKKNTNLSKEEKNALVQETAENLGISDLLKRYPEQLSGGQQQRVALGRVLVLSPKILLMDEPLSSLDTSLRIHVRQELKEIQDRLKITTIYVTHDQEEALSLSDNIAILDKGTLVQQGTPKDLYFNPANYFAATLTGKINKIHLDGSNYLVRPEWITLAAINDEKTDSAKLAQILSVDFLGAVIRYKLSWQNQIIYADSFASAYQHFSSGQYVYLEITQKQKSTS